MKNFSPTFGGPVYIQFYIYLPTGYNSNNWWGTGGEQLRLMKFFATSGNSVFTVQATSGHGYLGLPGSEFWRQLA